MAEKITSTGKIQGVIVLTLIIGLVGFAVWKNRNAFDSNAPTQRPYFEGRSRQGSSNTNQQTEDTASQLEKAEQEARLKAEQEKALQAEQQRLELEEQLKQQQEEQARLEQERAAQEQARREEEERRIAQAREEERERIRREVEKERAEREAQEQARRDAAAAKLLELMIQTVPVVQIQNVWVDYDIVENRQRGMVIHVKFKANNLLGTKCRIAAYFEYSDGKPLKDLNGDYATENGFVSVGNKFVPTYENSVYDDFDLFIPYRELHLGRGTHRLRFVVKAYRVADGHFFATSSYQYFSYSDEPEISPGILERSRRKKP